jgi:general L-amino acid transport system permease protein
MVNTIRLATAGIFFATVIGLFIGLARLSNNWVVNKLGSVFVETLRNIPLLVQILLYGAILANLGDLQFDSGWDNWVIWSNKGLSVPRVFIADGFYQWAVFMCIGALAARWMYNQRSGLHDKTGENTHPGLGSFAVLTIFGIVGWFIHPIFGWVGNIFGAISDGISKVPEEVLQLVLSAVAISIAANWIRGFLASRRTPGGSARLTDDDKFRIIFAGVGSVLAILVVFVVWPGLSSWIINSSSDLFEVLENKFGDGRTGGPFGVDRPEVVKPGKFEKYGPSGLTMSLGFAAVFFGIVLYTAAFIAEIVRGGILAVPKGQIEAANSLGMKRSTALRTVILPQALRVIMPPLGNQYLNLTKNTSLAIAVGFSDLVQVGQTVGNQTGKNLSVFAIWMLFYLACSLTISVAVNFFNVRLRIVER